MHKGGHYQRNKDKLYIEEQAERKAKQLRDSIKDERNSLRYQKLVAFLAKRILEKDSKILSLKDYSDAAKEAYGITDKIKTIRVKRMMSTDIAKRDVNETIRLLLAQKGYNEQKIADLLGKAEKEARNTKDYLDIMRELKAMIAPAITQSITQSIDFSEVAEKAEKRTKIKHTSTQ